MGGKILEYEAKSILRQGREEGKAYGMIELSLDLGKTNEEILSLLQRKLAISKEQAEVYLEQFYERN